MSEIVRPGDKAIRGTCNLSCPGPIGPISKQGWRQGGCGPGTWDERLLVNGSLLQPLSLLPKGTNPTPPEAGWHRRGAPTSSWSLQGADEPWVLLAEPLMPHGAQPPAGAVQRGLCPLRPACLGDTYPAGGHWACYSKGGQAAGSEARTHGCLPLNVQELGPAPERCSPGGKGYFCTKPLLSRDRWLHLNFGLLRTQSVGQRDSQTSAGG